MNDWLHNLPVVWMSLVVFGFTYLVAAAIYVVVAVLAVGERGRSFKAVSPGMLPPLGIIFGLFVAFTAAQVWSENERANAAVDREASALRTVVVLAAHHLLELCGLVDARVIDLDGVYDPCRPNDRLLLGMKGSISEYELGII